MSEKPRKEPKPKKMKKKKKKKGSVTKKVILIIVLVLLFLILAGGAVTAYLVVTNYNELPEWTEIEQEGKSQIYDRDGEFLVEIRGEENRDVVDYSAFPQYLIDAVIATEDTRFYEHNGIDFVRVIGAAIADLKSGSASQGGSTITMQLARNAILNTQEKKIDRKIKETLLAMQIERTYTKEEILTFYLNEVFLGQSVYGFEAAAQHYFNKSISDCSLSECATLVGMLPSPNLYAPDKDMDKAVSVRNQVLNNMVKYDYLTEEEAEQAKAEEIVVDIQPLGDSTDGFDWLTDYAILEASDILEELGYAKSKVYTGGFKIYTTKDSKTQQACTDTYANDSLFPKGVGVGLLQSAAVFMDPNTGEILAMQGGREYTDRFGLDRASYITTSDQKVKGRQPGSVIKPIAVYGPALEEGYSPNYRILDAPFTSGGYRPSNYDGVYRGMINMTTALKYSVNVTAVRLLQEIGVETGWEFAVSCGLPLVEEDKGPALALGGITYGVSPLNLATAYSCFANGGYYIEPTSILKITDKYDNVLYEHNPEKTQVMSEDTAYSMNTMLKATIQSGTGTKAAIGRPAAGKTGTTQLPDAFGNRKGNKDSWWAGYTPDIVGICWMGFDSDYYVDPDTGEKTPQYMVNVFGGQYPATVWKRIVQVALEDVPASDWEKPDGYNIGIDTSDDSEYEEEEEEEEEEEIEEEQTEDENNQDETPTDTPSNPTPPDNTPSDPTPSEPDTPDDSEDVPLPEASSLTTLSALQFINNYYAINEENQSQLFWETIQRIRQIEKVS